jgi:hypothetical protein
MSAIAQIFNEIERRGIIVRVDGENLRLAPKRALDPQLLRSISEHKSDVVKEVGRRATGSPSNLRPVESLEAVRRFHGQPHAKLFPFIGRKVRTPGGPGTLLQVFADRVTVLLDSEINKCAAFAPGQIEPVSWELSS